MWINPFLFNTRMSINISYFLLYLFWNPSQQSCQQLQRNVKAVVTTVLILGTYIVGWLPATLLTIIVCDDCLVRSDQVESKLSLFSSTTSSQTTYTQSPGLLQLFFVCARLDRSRLTIYYLFPENPRNLLNYQLQRYYIVDT